MLRDVLQTLLNEIGTLIPTWRTDERVKAWADAIIAARDAIRESDCRPLFGKRVERRSDMNSDGRLAVFLHEDGDIGVIISSLDGLEDVEFCVPGVGGGHSPRTIAALRELAVAMHADNVADPARRGNNDFREAEPATPVASDLVKCARCNGTGQLDDGDMIGCWLVNCKDCDGKGVVPQRTSDGH